MAKMKKMKGCASGKKLDMNPKKKRREMKPKMAKTKKKKGY